MANWLGLLFWALVGTPFYLWLVVSLGSHAYFRAKLEYHQRLFNGIDPQQSREN